MDDFPEEVRGKLDGLLWTAWSRCVYTSLLDWCKIIAFNTGQVSKSMRNPTSCKS